MNNLLNFKSFLKFLGRNKAYTLIDVFGLSVSLMFVLLIAVYTVQEMSTDKFHTKADRIYLVGNENWMATGAAIPYKIKERYPEVEKVCPVVADNSSNIVVVSGDRKLKANVMFADSTFFDFFDFRLLQGTREQALAAGNYAVVSSSFARKMFGTDDPMGRQLVVGDTISATINGVVEDLLHSSIPEADVIVRWEQVSCFNPSLAPDQLRNAGSTSAFVLVREGSDFPSRAEDMVGKTQGLPLFGSNNWTSTYQGQNISFQQFVMDKDCYDMLGLEILRDNHLTTEGWFLNEQAMREMNLSEDATSFMLDRHERPIAIAGIVRDFYCFGNVTTGMNPVMFRFLKDNEAPWMILIETQGDPFAAKEAIGKVYEKVTGLEFEAFFMDESLQNSFDSQIRLAKIVIVFSIIAILISLLGLLAMSTYFIQQRLQEVSVRKVFGSSNRQILVKLVFTFLNYVLIAFVIAIPIIMYFMKDWLSDYSYRIGLSPLIFIAAGLFCLVISFVSVFFQSYRAATSNPVDSFRHRL